MKVLIVAKKTNLELHGNQINQSVLKGNLDKSYLKKLQQSHDEHYNTLDILQRSLNKARIDFELISRGLYWPKLKEIGLVITVGGDGTILEASHHLKNDNIPIIGIRSSKMSVGLLCACSEDKIPHLIEKLQNDSLVYLKAHRIYAEITFGQTGGNFSTEPVLNDFLFANKSPALTSRYNLQFNQVNEDQKSSGVWISTATGSTAAIGAAGGQHIPRTSEECQYRVRELYHSHTTRDSRLKSATFDPSSNVLAIDNHSDEAILALDGQHGLIYLTFGDRLVFKRANPIPILEKVSS